jgi:hypothetical protein
MKMEKTGISRQKRMWNGIMKFHKVALRPFQITIQYASADALFYTFYIKKKTGGFVVLLMNEGEFTLHQNKLICPRESIIPTVVLIITKTYCVFRTNSSPAS